MTEPRPNIVLTGFMGTGKSTVGRILAEQLERTFVDTDAEIERRHGPIPQIFAEQGEQHFRRLERALAAELSQRRGLVIATGGRLMLDADNARALGASGDVVCLTADASTIVARVLADGTQHRPLLDGPDPERTVRTLLAERASGYAAFPTIDCGIRSASEVAREVLLLIDDPAGDPHRALEDVHGPDALAWVSDRNAEAETSLGASPAFADHHDRTLAILETDLRIDEPLVRGEDVFNFWTDEANPRGLLRRTDWPSYRSGDPEWETVLDVGRLGRDEGTSWVFAGMSLSRHDDRRALVSLSAGGGDSTTTRELDVSTGEFVPADAGGFVRPEAKGGLVWLDRDTVFVLHDFGPGTVTTSGYARTVRRWERGTPIEEAAVVFSGEVDDVAVSVTVTDDGAGGAHVVLARALDFYRSEHWLLRADELERLPLPDDCDVSIHGGRVAVHNRSDWTRAGVDLPAGSVAVGTLEQLLDPAVALRSAFVPTTSTALHSWSWTRSRLILCALDDVRPTVIAFDATGADPASWTTTEVAPTGSWVVDVSAVDPDRSDDLWLRSDDLVSPPTLVRQDSDGSRAVIRRQVDLFASDGLTLTQHFATSEDGTRIPYFEVAVHGADGPQPTLLRGYGGFEVPELPRHAPSLGANWLERGHRFVLANIRGGGEFGPRWHRAGLREKRHRIYEDFEAVARDLVSRGVTTTPQLACTGGSNGGLLTGNMYVRSPELWGAIVCQVPLLDMRRYHRLLAGASWMAEYGDPDDPADWAHLRTYSPYHLVDGAATHPPLLLMSSTRDDRVHPGHARKMAALLRSLGKDVTYWENVEGGHGGAADARQRARFDAFVYAFLDRTIVSAAPA